MTSVDSSKLTIGSKSSNTVKNSGSAILPNSKPSSVNPIPTEPKSVLQSVTEILEEQEEEYDGEEEYDDEEEEEEQKPEEIIGSETTNSKATIENKASTSVKPSKEISQTQSETKDDSEEVAKSVPKFICHGTEGGKPTKHQQGQQQFRSAAKMASTVKSAKSQRTIRDSGSQMNDEASEEEEDEFIQKPNKGTKYLLLYPDELEYRAATMAPSPTIIKQITIEAHHELHRLGCQRMAPDRHKGRQPDAGGKHLEEGMQRRLDRLKVYRRVMGSLVIYFRAYAPILVKIKKSYENMLTFRLRQFKEAQHEKALLHHEKLEMHDKMVSYQFPDHHKLQTGRFYLTLLLTRIQKQDEAIKCITEILSKMERCLSDHYEQQRDLEEQIKRLESEIADRRERSKFPMKRFETEESLDIKNLGTEVKDPDNDGNRSGSEDEAIDENEEMDEDKRMVIILAYAVCLKDFEEAEKKLRFFENKYQNVSPRHELEEMKKHIIEEKDHVKVLLDERERLEQELLDLKGQNDSVDEELEDLQEMPEDLRLDTMMKKFAETRGLGTTEMDESLTEMLDDISEDEDGNGAN